MPLHSTSLFYRTVFFQSQLGVLFTIIVTILQQIHNESNKWSLSLTNRSNCCSSRYWKRWTRCYLKRSRFQRVCGGLTHYTGLSWPLTRSYRRLRWVCLLQIFVYSRWQQKGYRDLLTVELTNSTYKYTLGFAAICKISTIWAVIDMLISTHSRHLLRCD